MIENGVINLDSEFGKKIGFTSDRFGSSWLWKKGNDMYISMVIAKTPGQGHFREVYDNLRKEGYTIKIPTPFAILRDFCERHGFKKTVEHDEKAGDCEIWVKPAEDST